MVTIMIGNKRYHPRRQDKWRGYLVKMWNRVLAAAPQPPMDAPKERSAVDILNERDRLNAELERRVLGDPRIIISNHETPHKEQEATKELGPVTETSRGFELLIFRDIYDKACSLQQSSLVGMGSDIGAHAVWLGEEQSGSRMHLDRTKVLELINVLQRWVDTGSFIVQNKP